MTNQQIAVTCTLVNIHTDPLLIFFPCRYNIYATSDKGAEVLSCLQVQYFTLQYAYLFKYIFTLLHYNINY